ncbi:MAG TPA: L,D-transpeptidase, partial [Solirubrobacteraceae bacterium]|nr:L,D-transpeptidase [Solirubrobacteraceae bacterium]
TPYTFVTVSESEPETLQVHVGNRVAISTPANTGVAGAETELGTFPIYARYVSTTMTGTNPDGSHYSDPGVPWVNYFNGGDAVHGFPRASYGFPQSNGCVELPIGTAGRVFPLLAIGDLVIVS